MRTETRQRAHAYIDGFNLYYGLRGTPSRWLNVARLVSLLVPGIDLGHIRYFTARVEDRPGDPGQAQRQDTYLRALRTIPNLTIHEGRFLASEVRAAVVNPVPGSPKTVLIHKTEEKGSDVNLATYLLVDGFRDLYDEAVVISNDTDLREPIYFARTELEKRVTVLNPRRRFSRTMSECASAYRKISLASFRAAQFPAVVITPDGNVHRPPGWEAPHPVAEVRVD